MTIGIYSLYWGEQDLIYIGQSQNIESRFKEHINLLNKNKHTNYKVQNAFNSYGLPKLIIIEECSINLLNDLEICWQKEFNSINSLDLIEAGQVGYGVNSNSSKYTKLQVLLVFKDLYKSNKNHKEIAFAQKVNIGLVDDISRGSSHLWIKYKYPKLYSKMKKLQTYRVIGVKDKENSLKGIVKSPDGEIYEVYNIEKFCREHNLRGQHLGAVINSKRKIHLGWILHNGTL